MALAPLSIVKSQIAGGHVIHHLKALSVLHLRVVQRFDSVNLFRTYDIPRVIIALAALACHSVSTDSLLSLNPCEAPIGIFAFDSA
jgi:hypothetical protein